MKNWSLTWRPRSESRLLKTNTRSECFYFEIKQSGNHHTSLYAWNTSCRSRLISSTSGWCGWHCAISPRSQKSAYRPPSTRLYIMLNALTILSRTFVQLLTSLECLTHKFVRSLLSCLTTSEWSSKPQTQTVQQAVIVSLALTYSFFFCCALALQGATQVLNFRCYWTSRLFCCLFRLVVLLVSFVHHKPSNL